jgi:hypothetical protein
MPIMSFNSGSTETAVLKVDQDREQNTFKESEVALALSQTTLTGRSCPKLPGMERADQRWKMRFTSQIT